MLLFFLLTKTLEFRLSIIGAPRMETEREEVPEWLRNCKTNAIKSPEWRELLGEVFRKTKTLMSHDHITFFSELQPDEKALYMSRVEDAVKSSPAYQKFSIRLRQSVDSAASMSIKEDMSAGKYHANASKVMFIVTS